MAYSTVEHHANPSTWPQEEIMFSALQLFWTPLLRPEGCATARESIRSGEQDVQGNGTVVGVHAEGATLAVSIDGRLVGREAKAEGLEAPRPPEELLRDLWQMLLKKWQKTLLQ